MLSIVWVFEELTDDLALAVDKNKTAGEKRGLLAHPRSLPLSTYFVKKIIKRLCLVDSLELTLGFEVREKNAGEGKVVETVDPVGGLSFLYDIYQIDNVSVDDEKILYQIHHKSTVSASISIRLNCMASLITNFKPTTKNLNNIFSGNSDLSLLQTEEIREELNKKYEKI